jgi:hypothetical protein
LKRRGKESSGGDEVSRPIIIGIIVIVAILGVFGIASGAKWLFDVVSTSQATTKSIADSAMAAITKEWDINSLNGLTTPDYEASIKSNDATAWATYKTLGAALSLEPCSSLGLNITNGNGLAQLSCSAKFASGTANFDMTLATSDWGHSWKISSLALRL